MARNIPIQILRTTRANLDTQIAADGLLAGEPYLVTDESRLAVGLGIDTVASALMSGDIGVSVQAHDGDTAKLDTAQTWTASQYLSAGGTLGVATVASAGSSQTVNLDGKIHVLTLDSATCTITASAVGSAYSAALIITKQDGSGSRAISWAGSPKTLDTQALNTTSSKHSAWLLWTPDGGTTLCLSGAGAEA
jgi:hypothetical protein